jgi:CheY-like chemotaxis protein
MLAPVLVILDLNLAGAETGLDVLDWIRQQPEPLASTPALVLTGSARQRDRDESTRLGAMIFLQKPVTEESLTRAVQSLGFVIVSNLTSGQLGLRIIERR